MMHWQVGLGPTHALCGSSRGDIEPHRCLTNCEPCEGDRDVVDCGNCIEIGKHILDNLTYFHRHYGPHPLKDK
jgi:hypothetical protein